ncbi:MAG TPA: riboflavin synthase [Burkholderiaceae bacterium]|nr:riboflavin synthase [Burkholderiaceae bacterium]
MFTGIVQATGRIVAVDDHGAGRRVRVEASSLGLHDVRIGDSIAVNGACMTVTEVDTGTFSFDISAESLSKTAGLDRPGEVNLERAMRFGDRIDGHLASGHVDATGTVVRFEQRAESWTLVVESPPALARYLAYKGSISVDGVSLTINHVEDVDVDGVRTGCRFWVNLIPHTLAVTTLKALRPGDPVNLEVDLIARYVARMLESRSTTARRPRQQRVAK